MPPKGWKKPIREQLELRAINDSLDRYERLLRWWARGRHHALEVERQARAAAAEDTDG